MFRSREGHKEIGTAKHVQAGNRRHSRLPGATRRVVLVQEKRQPPQRMTIDIKFTYYQKLLDVRRAALAEGFLTSDEYVPAVITYRGKKANVQLRLKGDMANQHLAGEQWSFRVKVRGEDTLLGMKRFSLHHPRARYYLSEWVFHKIHQLEGFVALRYEFLFLTVNGKNLGLYALEEHFGEQPGPRRHHCQIR